MRSLLNFACSLTLLMTGATLRGADTTVLLAGAAAVDISPQTLPAFQNGGFLQAKSDRVVDPLHARSLVISDGSETIAMVIVDSCMLPTFLCDKAKHLASQETGIPIDRILISATHTHMAPSSMLCLGCPADDPYVQYVPARIAKSIVEAHQNLQPAKIGWTVVDGSELTNCRRWITRSDKMGVDPFGQKTVRAMMHPGYQNPSYTSPAGPIDPWLSVLSVVSDKDATPICVMANLSMHYFGGGGFSADYFGEVARLLKERMQKDNAENVFGFVGIMSQGTSGDLHWMDYSQPRQAINRQQYSQRVADHVLDAVAKVEHRSDHSLAMSEKRLTIDLRKPSKDRRQWARPINAARGELLPRTRVEVYAQQAEWIHEHPSAEVVLQAVRIGDLGITAMPNEVYGITGLKLKRQSPLAATFNLELANGATGYIPPPEQHQLGGYTTWPARTAGLEEQAEPQVVEALLSLLEQVSGKKRRTIAQSDSPYSQALRDRKPIAHWQLDDMTSEQLVDSIENHSAQYHGAVALFLPGPEAAGFAAEGYGSRAVYLAGGHVEAKLQQAPKQYSLAMSFQNMLPAGVREVTGVLFSNETETLLLGGTASSEYAGRLLLHSGQKIYPGKTPISPIDWHQIIVTRDDQRIRVYLNGGLDPEIDAPVDSPKPVQRLLIGSDGVSQATFDGKIDEVAVFDRALKTADVDVLYQVSGMVPPPRPKPMVVLAAKSTDAKSRGKYADAVLASKPVAFWRLHGGLASQAKNAVTLSSLGTNAPAANAPAASAAVYEDGSKPLEVNSNVPNFSGGRVKVKVPDLGDTYSIELWVRNELAVGSRPVTAYVFSRAVDGVDGAMGDNLGIGGTHSDMGRLIVFNGNQRDQLVAGKTPIVQGSWSHVVMVREDQRITVYLNGDVEPEIEEDLPIGYPDGCEQILLGGRADNFANLQGMMEEIALYDRALNPAEVAAHFKAAAVKQIKDPQDAVSAILADPTPTDAGQAIDTIQVRDGFEVQLVAAEPLVQDPVAIDWGPDGKLWVVEMADYPLGLDGKGQPGGRVRFLEDTNSDGLYDKTTLFAEGLSFPTGVLVWGNGILVTAAPQIVYLEDTSGDGKADVQRPLYSGFLQGNQQLRVNGLRWGLDNWVYCASGSHHGGYGKDSEIKSLQTGAEYCLGSRDFRLRPDKGLMDPQSGPSQYGRSRDDWGNWFGVQNSHPLWHYVLADQNIRRNSHYAPPDPKHQVVTPANPPVYPASNLQKRYHSFSQSGRFTSACSPMIYRDAYLFERGTEQHAFTCEPFHNLVQHNLIRDEGVSFAFRRDPEEAETDFFASEDRWCRPVMVRTGPEGALWVVDMYRYMIEHPQWLPENGQNELRPWFRAGQDRGRIYRIVRQNQTRDHDQTFGSGKTLAEQTATELAAVLEKPNGWQRDMAQRMLVRGDHQSAVPVLEDLLQTSRQPLARLHALWTLEGLGRLSVDSLEAVLSDQHPGVRRNAVRVASTIKVDVDCLTRLTDDPDPKVKMELMSCLGNYQTPVAASALGQLMAANANDHYMIAAAMSSLNPGNVSDVLASLINTSAKPDLVRELIGQAVAMGDAETIERVLEVVHASTEGKAGDRHFASLAMALDGLEVRKWPISRTSDDARRRIADSIQEARECATDESAEVERRGSAVHLLGREQDNQESDFDLLAELLGPRSPVFVQQQVVSRLAKINDPEVAEVLLDGWQSRSPEQRKQILNAIVSRAAWSASLLAHVQNGSISSSELPAPVQQRLLNANKNSGSWKELLSAKVSADRAAVLARYASAIKLEGEATRGKKLFRKLCINCHRINGEGYDVGPKLASITNKTKEAILASIIDPSGAVDANYFNYSVLTADGRTFSGKLETETATSITLLAAEGKRTTVLRDNIEMLKASRKSLMPDGLEQNLELQDVADLVQYVQDAFR
ncbi:HEAT repeat domain-containing protein [Rubripirellula sp.]|nr:PVC-type heme-binding CxxCH protein [Rubripirellula sp.]MDB4644573.1 HEAT repeat domain-containing protein [Rubripirellula sp.]